LHTGKLGADMSIFSAINIWLRYLLTTREWLGVIVVVVVVVIVVVVVVATVVVVVVATTRGWLSHCKHL